MFLASHRGHSYERAAVETYIDKKVEAADEVTDPMARDVITDFTLTPNLGLKAMIDEYKKNRDEWRGGQ